MSKILVTLIIFFSPYIYAYQCGDQPFTSTIENDGKKIGLFATKKDFEDSPEWNIEDGEPPLSISAAVNLVKSWSKSFYPRFDSITISSFRLQNSTCWSVNNQWVYVFNLSPIMDGNKLRSSAYMVAVTMGGKILEPKQIND